MLRGLALSITPYRSALYVPGSNDRAMAKSSSLDVDAILFDLEDAVAPEAKGAARAAMVAALGSVDFGHRARIVRINDLGSPWGADDIAALAGTRPDGLLLPKVRSAGDMDGLASMTAGTGLADCPLWAMMETPQAILNAGEICLAPRMAGIVVGTNDLAKDLHLPASAPRASMAFALQACVLAARAAGIVAIDGVYNAFRDVEGLERECTEGRALGFDGKSLIHPAQVPVANRVFAPDEDEVALARRQVAAFTEAAEQGQGVAVLDGKIVENLHLEQARATLAKADAIERRDAP